MSSEQKFSLKELGINQEAHIKRNLPIEKLTEETVLNGEGVIGMNGAVMVDTGTYTGRSPNDKFIVEEPSSKNVLWWGPVNRKVSEYVFDELYNKVIAYYNAHTASNTYVFDGFAGADTNYRLNVRVVAKKSWQAHFCQNMFINPLEGELSNFTADFTIINASDVHNEKFAEHGLNSETFILFHLGKKIAIIGGTEYGGEMKKGIFSVLHYILPLKGVLSMHCSANIDKSGRNTALFFGLSGTGKTTLSTDPNRPLIGDDEHG
ncbi:MAG: phosphoenolpyruvate carboxykinase (ATP), partial [Candidatus Marinimicrobia bacterium]|nr:phosphoenolpyruvate carboxykinase (ATP) [Candidatus Neomarinimicrobiota bacterium]